jgi:MFS family permease
MTVGPLVSAGGLLLFSRIGPGDHYVTAVFPAAVLFGLGMTITVAPLTSAVLGAVDSRRAGVASGVNNAAARLAGLLGIAVIPALAGIDNGAALARSLDHGYATALRISAAVCACGGVISWLFVRTAAPVHPLTHPATVHACHDAACVHGGDH